MADVDFSAVKLGVLLGDKIGKGLAEGSKLLQFLSIANGRSGVSNGVSWNVDGYGSAAVNFAAGAAWTSLESANSMLTLTQPWARFAVKRKILGDTIRLAQLTDNPSEIADQMAVQARSSARSLIDKIGDQLFSGDGTSNKLAGLALAVADDNTYGGLNRLTAANTPMRSQEFDPGSPTALTEDHLIADILNTEDYCGVRPTHAFCNAAVMAKVLKLVAGKVTVPVILPGINGPVKMSYGIDSVNYMGVEFVLDRHATDNCIYYVNMNEMVLRIAPGLPGVTVPVAIGESGALPVNFVMKNNDGDYVEFVYFVQTQLEVTSPACFSVRKNISV